MSCLQMNPLFLFFRLTDKAPKEYAVYRSPLLFWGLVDLVYDMFRVNTFVSKLRCLLKPQIPRTNE